MQPLPIPPWKPGCCTWFIKQKRSKVSGLDQLSVRDQGVGSMLRGLKQGEWGCDGGHLEQVCKEGAWPPARRGGEEEGWTEPGEWRWALEMVPTFPWGALAQGRETWTQKRFLSPCFKLWGLWRVFVCWWEPLREGRLGQAGNEGVRIEG